MKREMLAAAFGLSMLSGCETTSDQELAIYKHLIRVTSTRKVDIDKLLKNVAETPLPTNPNIGAMCYVMKGPPLRTEYICPTCGTKMIYVFSKIEALDAPANAVIKYRSYIDQLNQLGLAVRLDESFLCGKCYTKEKPAYFLDVKFKDRVVRNELLGEADLLKLIAFVKGDLVWGSRSSNPLKPELPRIRQLLGVKE